MTIETKYDPDETVWVMVENKVKEAIIYEVIPGTRLKGLKYSDTYSIKGSYGGSGPTFYEDKIFKTKEELLNSL